MIMMKTLLLIRHAEAQWDAFGQADIQRTLTERGIEQVHDIANSMKGESLIPNAIFSSSAKRAEMTALLLVPDIDFAADKIQWCDDLYLAEAEHIFATAQQADDAIQTLAIIAHNPGLSELAHYLLPNPTNGMSPATVVAITWPVEHWQDISAKTGALRAHLQPNI